MNPLEERLALAAGMIRGRKVSHLAAEDGRMLAYAAGMLGLDCWTMDNRLGPAGQLKIVLDEPAPDGGFILVHLPT